MELQNVELRYKDKFTNLYHLKYKNLNKEEKIYELLSRKELNNNFVGKHIDAITMVIKHKSLNKYLLLREYRLAVNTFVYNLVAGLMMKEKLLLKLVLEKFGRKQIYLLQKIILYILWVIVILLLDYQMNKFKHFLLKLMEMLN